MVSSHSKTLKKHRACRLLSPKIQATRVLTEDSIMLDDSRVPGQILPLGRPYVRQESSNVSMEDKNSHKQSTILPGMTTQELQAYSFPENFSLASKLPQTAALLDTATQSTVVSDVGTEPASNEHKNEFASSSVMHTSLSLEGLRRISEDANSKVSAEIAARIGNTQQRWAVDPHNGRLMRLVAGCVPILSDGRIILITSSVKKDKVNKDKGWLIPKGGWELDESLEEGAIRECFEESGVLGTLGPKFDSFSIEARKARRRRLELEEKLRQKPEAPTPDSFGCSGWSVLSQLSEEDHLTDETSNASEEPSKISTSPSSMPISLCNSSVSPAPEGRKSGVKVMFQLSDHEKAPMLCDLNQLVPAVDAMKPDVTEETGSTSSLTHTHTCMTFFPLYVQSIHDSWPESTRTRRAFDIDGKFSSCFVCHNLVCVSQLVFRLVQLQRRFKWFDLNSVPY